MNKLSYFFILLIGCIACQDATINSEGEVLPDYTNVEKWGLFELSFEAEELEDPYSTPPLRGIFTQNGERKVVNGFYDGDGVYKLRFMPTSFGIWEYQLASELDSIDGIVGALNCTAPSENNKGMVQVHDTYHFQYKEGENYFPFGTTLYAWFWQGDDLEDETVQTLRENEFNKVRMLVFPKNYPYVQNMPQEFPFEGNTPGNFDFNEVNYEYFQDLEKRIEQLMELGIEADVILFHPYDYWGFSSMGMEANKKYIQYLVARLAAYRNVWWSMANEYQLVENLDDAEWNELGRYVAEQDPYGHLNSIHNANGGFFDFTQPWITHASIQVQDLDPLIDWKQQYNKPIVADEVGYEGNIPYKWGNLSAEELIFRFWVGTARGGYVSHGETFQHPNNVLWWAKGGQLYGEAPDRIAFLKEIVKNYGKGLQGKAGEDYIAEGEGYVLHYLGKANMQDYSYDLPDNSTYQVDIIDTWNMTIENAGDFQGNVSLQLPNKPYLAIRMQRK